MNEAKFQSALEELMHRSPVGIHFMSSWYEQTLEQLKSLSAQNDAIKHPRFRGDSRENDFASILGSVMPPAVAIKKGFVVDPYATPSFEQDCLLLDSRAASALVRSSGTAYYPIESVLASIEIKSKLTLAELRKSVLNCVSLKKLNCKKNETDVDKSKRIAYFVFAYDCPWSLSGAAEKIQSVLQGVPVDLRPNMFYLVDKGALLPRVDRGFVLGPPGLFVDAPFDALDQMRVAKNDEATHALPFLWFLSNIVDHCMAEIFSREAGWIGQYIHTPMALQRYVEKKIQEGEGET